LLGQSLHLLGIVFVFFFFLLYDVLFEAATFFRRRRRIKGGLNRLAIGAVADLIVLGLFEFTLQADIDLFGPGVLGKLLLTLCGGLLDLGDTFLQFLVLCAQQAREAQSGESKERQGSLSETELSIFHLNPLVE
jgi:hypothetical protein